MTGSSMSGSRMVLPKDDRPYPIPTGFQESRGDFAAAAST